MRSSGLTTVSRTSERMPSVRRNRRARRTSRERPVVTSLVEGVVFVVIGLSVEIVRPRARRRAEAAAADRAVRAVGAEPAKADAAAIEAGLFFRVAAADADSFGGLSHLEISRSVACLSIVPAAGGVGVGGVAQMVRAGVS